MRVIAGKLKGRRLAAVRGASIRPTSDRVRESLFSILREAIPEAAFLDVFAGTGSVGIEAHSRGASNVAFIESHALDTLRSNLYRCGLLETVRLLPIPATKALKQLAAEGASFDIIFMDPPYDSPVLEESLSLCAQSSVLLPDGCIVAEHRQTQVLDQRFGPLCCVRNETYGDTVLSFFVWDD